MQTLQEHEAVLRAKCLNGTLYRNDTKLATWLGVDLDEVNRVIDQLLSARVLRFDGISHAGTERYTLGPVGPAIAETAGLRSGTGAPATFALRPAPAINADRAASVLHNRACLEAGPYPETTPDCPACKAKAGLR